MLVLKLFARFYLLIVMIFLYAEPRGKFTLGDGYVTFSLINNSAKI